METFTVEQYKNKYGDKGVWLPVLNQTDPDLNPNTRPSIGETIANSFKSGINQAKEGFNQIGNDRSGNPLNLIEGVGKIGAGAIGAAFSPLAPITEPTIGASIKYAADKLSDIPAVQKFADTNAGKTTARVAENVANYATIAGTVGGAMEVPKVGGAVESRVNDAITTTKSAISKAGEKISPSLKNAVRDVIPTSENIVNHQITQALELTQGDIKNISKATGHEVGQFLADNNLIGENVKATQTKLTDFYKQNYNAVRSEIAKVTKAYKESSIPRYTEALTELKKQVSEVPGLQKANSEIDALLKKTSSIDRKGNFVPNKKATISLDDVQKVKELMDDHFNLYKVTGDVKEGIAKEGLANIRKDLKGFIEKQVKEKTGTEIKKFNNNVQTARSIIDAVESRSTRGLTRSHLSLGDYGTFLSGTAIGGPVVGTVAFFLKKLYQSPSVKLRVAQYLDSISDIKKAAIQAELEAGKVPVELKKLIK